MVEIQVTDKQAKLIESALDLYLRIGLGQFGQITNHPTYRWKTSPEEEDKAIAMLNAARNLLEATPGRDPNSSQSIYHEGERYEVNRQAWDLVQSIRHEFWKALEEKPEHSTASSVFYCAEDSHKIKVKVFPDEK